MTRLLRKLRWLTARRRKEAELRDELAFHLEQEVEEGRAAGFSDDKARRAARLDLGNHAVVVEDVRSAWGWIWIERLGQDVRYAARMLRRRPGFSIAAILTLMLGIGGNTAVFSLFDALLLRNLPVDRPDELVSLVEPRTDPGPGYEVFTLSTYDALQQRSTSFSSLIASSQLYSNPLQIEERGEKQKVFLQQVSDNYFDVLGVTAALGRVFHRATAGSSDAPIVVISDDYWRRHYAATASALGSRVRVRNVEFTVAGITRPGFRGMEIDVPVDMWVSIDQVVPANSPERTRGRSMRVMGRLQPSTSLERAEAESRAILNRTVTLRPGGNGYSTLRGRLSQPLQLVALVVALVLLIACANLANLMLASTSSRDRELSVRTAIGASRARILRQLLTESGVLAVIGGVLGIGLAYAISGALLSFLPPSQATALPNLRFALSVKVLGFAALLSTAACALFGLAPALRATASGAGTHLKSGSGAGPQRSWFSRGLLVSQVVMCTALLVLASVFVRTLQNLRGQDSGYLESHLLVADVAPPREYPEVRRDQLLEALRARVTSLPGVELAAFSHLGQLSGGALEYQIGFPGQFVPEKDKPVVIEQRMSPGFLRAMGTAFVAGRDFAESDEEGAALVAIVNESFAHKFFPDRNPIGARFSRDFGTHSGELMEVVAVVRDSKWVNLRNDAPPMYYRPYQQMGGTPVVRFAIRTSGEPTRIAGELLRAAQALDPGLVVENVVPFREIVNRTLVVERLTADVSTAFGVIALLIAAVGLYGVLAYNVVKRRREIGVRIAIGAAPGAVQWMFLRESLTLLCVGVALGLPAAILVTRYASSMLYGLSPQDLGSIVAALSVLTVATGAAAYIPARRAVTVDPVVALREV